MGEWDPTKFGGKSMPVHLLFRLLLLGCIACMQCIDAAYCYSCIVVCVCVCYGHYHELC